MDLPPVTIEEIRVIDTITEYALAGKPCKEVVSYRYKYRFWFPENLPGVLLQPKVSIDDVIRLEGDGYLVNIYHKDSVGVICKL